MLALRQLLAKDRPNDKVLVFTQFADTAQYLYKEMASAGNSSMLPWQRAEARTPRNWRGGSARAATAKWREAKAAGELRVLIATDVLSEGQNLQDAFVVVNYDLPWAIIRLIQRAGRVDRIGQKAEEILCYSFLPAKGVEKIIKLRSRVRQRLAENAEVVGTDEAFFEDDKRGRKILDLYHEKAGVLDGDEDGEVDLASKAFQIWKNAIEADPGLQKTITGMPRCGVFRQSAHANTADSRKARWCFCGRAKGTTRWRGLTRNGESVTESQYAILRAAECVARYACRAAPENAP